MKIKENEKRDKYLDLDRELRNLWNKKVTVIPFVSGALGTITKRLGKRAGRVGNQKSEDHPGFSIVEIGQNTKSHGDLRRLVVTQTPENEEQLVLV